MKAIFCFAIMCLLNSMLAAQNLGSILGRVVGERTNSPIPGANVTVIGKTFGSITDSSGWYNIKNVSEGIYEIQVSYIGYRTYRKPDIRVVRNKTTQVTEIKITESSIEAGEVTVTAGVFQDNNDMPVSSFNLTRDEIKRSPGAAGDIFRALATLPGVATEGGEVSAFSVRGGGPKDNLILVDNIPFTKVSHFDDGGIEGEEARGGRFSVFAPTLIENADFSAGGFPARYGSKYSSIIDMKIKEGNINDMTLYGHYDLFGWETNYDGPMPLLDKSGLIVSMRHVDFKTILKMVDEEGHGNPVYTDILVKNSIEAGASHKISLLGIYSDDKYTRTIDNVFSSKDINENELMNHNDSRYITGLNDRYLLGTSGFIQTTAYYYRNKVSGKEGFVQTASDYGIVPTKENCYVRDNLNRVTVNEHTYGLKSDITLSLFDQASLFAGIESRRNEYHYTMSLDGLDTIYVFNSSDIRMDYSKNYLIVTPEQCNQDNFFKSNYYAGYAEVSLKLSPLFTVSPGIRYEYYTYNAGDYFSPRFSMRYQLTPDMSLNVSTGIYYQLPELSNLAVEKTNGKLRNERAYHFIAGTSVYLLNDLKLTVESYYKKFDNLLVRTNRYDMQYSNDGSGWAGGFDISIVKRFTDQYFGQASYSYTISKRNDNNGDGEYDYRFSKPHMFNILSGYQFNEEWSVTAKWLITSGLPTDDYIIHRDIFGNPNYVRFSEEIIKKNGRRFTTNQSFDMRVDYRKQFKYFALSFYLDIWNLFDTKNISGEEFLPQTGKFTNEALGIIPSFGFNIEF